jgi:hypothetical protein
VQLFGWKFRRRTRGRWHRAEALLGPWCAENPLPRFPRLGRLPIRLQIHPEWQARKWSPPVGALRLGCHTAARRRAEHEVRQSFLIYFWPASLMGSKSDFGQYSFIGYSSRPRCRRS